MLRSRPELRVTRVLLLAMIAACAGCWQKIEYKPSASSKPKVANSQVAESTAAKTASPSDAEVPVSAPAAATEPDRYSPATAPAPNSNDDRYAATPPSQSVGTDDSNSASAPPPTAATDASQPVDTTIAPPPAETASSPPTLPIEGQATKSRAAKPESDDRYAAPAATANTSPATAPPPQLVATDAGNSPSPKTSVSPTGLVNNAQPPATVSTPVDSKALNSRHAAWILGSRLSLAALANDRQLAAKNVPIWLADAQSAAKLLDISISDLPAPGPAYGGSNASKQVLDYLLVNGQRIGHDLGKQYGPVESSLFEVALKSNLLLLIYRPGTPTVDSVSAALQEAAVRAKLPDKLWQPLIDAINTQAPPKEVQNAIKKLHSDVEQYLASGASPKGR